MLYYCARFSVSAPFGTGAVVQALCCVTMLRFARAKSRSYRYVFTQVHKTNYIGISYLNIIGKLCRQVTNKLLVTMSPTTMLARMVSAIPIMLSTMMLIIIVLVMIVFFFVGRPYFLKYYPFYIRKIVITLDFSLLGYFSFQISEFEKEK